MEDEKLVEMAKASFSFLEKDYSFKLETVKQKNNSLNTLQYRSEKRDLGIDIEVETIDFGVYVLLVSLNKGEEPDGYYINRKGETVREHLFRYLDKKSRLPNGYFNESRKRYKDLKNANSETKKYKIVQEIIDLKVTLLKDNFNHIK